MENAAMRITKAVVRDAKRNLVAWSAAVARMTDDALEYHFKLKYPNRAPDMVPSTPGDLRAELLMWGLEMWLPDRMVD